jgi:xanthine dehydrogenase accessory factor
MRPGMLQMAQAVSELLARGERAALATVVRAAGSTPQEPGARLLLYEDGRTLGTVGGGRIEQVVLEALDRAIRDDGAPRTVAWDLGRDLGMCCGGRMEVFIEPLDGSARLVVFGAGHVACATARLAQRIGFRLVIVDEREELNSEERFPGCTRLLDAYDDALRRLEPRATDWMLVMTHDHRLDEETLAKALAGPHRYIGMIGSRRKVLRITQRIEARYGAPMLARVFAPVGLDLGALGPEEIAVSIAAELIALRHGRSAPHLRVTGVTPIAISELATPSQVTSAATGAPERSEVES